MLIEAMSLTALKQVESQSLYDYRIYVIKRWVFVIWCLLIYLARSFNMVRNGNALVRNTSLISCQSAD